ncbi:MAG TPA: PDZ domain-containing protein [Pyrinomonadaceae bacterium]|nr:PDZ domain-containing protein [Pyrinomonadaceae bacterium]
MRGRVELRLGLAGAAHCVWLLAACCGAAFAQEVPTPAALPRQQTETRAPKPVQPVVRPSVVTTPAPQIPTPAPSAPAAPQSKRAMPTQPTPKASPLPPRQVVTVVQRLSGWKLLTWLATSGPPAMQLDSLPSTGDAHTNIVAGYVYEDGRTVVVRLPQSEAELDSFPDPPPGFFAAPAAAQNEQPEFTLVTADGRRVEAKFVGRDAATGLSMLEAAQPIFPGLPEGDTGDTDDPTVGQRVHLYAPAPAAQTAPKADGGYILLSINQREGRLTEVRRAPSGKPFRVVASASVSPEWTGAVAANEAGEVVGIVSQSGSGETQIVPVATVRSACDRVLRLRGSAPQPWLGVRGDAAFQAPLGTWVNFGWKPETALPHIQNRQGVFLTSVAPGTPAALAGLRPGDVIARVGPREVRSVEDLSLTLDEEGVGSTVDFTVLRAFEAKPLKLPVQLQGAQNPALATALSEERAARESLLSLRREVREIQAQQKLLNGGLPPPDAAALARLSERLREAEGRLDRILPLIADAETRAGAGRGFAPVIAARSSVEVEPFREPTPLLAFGLRAIGLTGRGAARLKARGGTLVVAVRPESPAAKSGLRAGDVIETIDGAPADSLSLRRLLTAFDAKPATLGVVRAGRGLTLKFSLAGDGERQK